MSNLSCRFALNRLIPVLIRETPESPGPPGPKTRTPMRSLGTLAGRRAMARPKVGPAGFFQSTGTCSVAHSEPATTSGFSLPTATQGVHATAGAVQVGAAVGVVGPGAAVAGTAATPTRVTPRTTPHVVVRSRRTRVLTRRISCLRGNALILWQPLSRGHQV